MSVLEKKTKYILIGVILDPEVNTFYCKMFTLIEGNRVDVDCFLKTCGYKGGNKTIKFNEFDFPAYAQLSSDFTSFCFSAELSWNDVLITETDEVFENDSEAYFKLLNLTKALIK